MNYYYFSICVGTYKSEENQLLLKVYQVKGPTEHYYSKFKNDNWAMDGYVRQTFFFINTKTNLTISRITIPSFNCIINNNLSTPHYSTPTVWDEV